MKRELQEAFDHVTKLASQGRWSDAVQLVNDFPALAREEDGLGRCLLAEVACFAGSRSLMEALIAHGAVPDGAGKSGATPLANIIVAGSTHGLSSLDELKLLLDNGASTSIRAEAGYPPLHWAIVNNRLDHARALLERGADPLQTTTDLTPETAVQVARRIKNEHAIRMLEAWSPPTSTTP